MQACRSSWLSASTLGAVSPPAAQSTAALATNIFNLAVIFASVRLCRVASLTQPTTALTAEAAIRICTSHDTFLARIRHLLSKSWLWKQPAIGRHGEHRAVGAEIVGADDGQQFGKPRPGAVDATFDGAGWATADGSGFVV